MFTPKRHHHNSRTVYKRGSSASLCFFTSFHPSKSFTIREIVTSYNQSIGLLEWADRYSFVLLNGFEPKKPLKAANGEGCRD